MVHIVLIFKGLNTFSRQYFGAFNYNTLVKLFLVMTVLWRFLGHNNITAFSCTQHNWYYLGHRINFAFLSSNKKIIDIIVLFSFPGGLSITMTIDRARELLTIQIELGGGYNRNSAKLILAEVEKEHGQSAVDGLIRELNLQPLFGFVPGEKIFI